MLGKARLRLCQPPPPPHQMSPRGIVQQPVYQPCGRYSLLLSPHPIWFGFLRALYSVIAAQIHGRGDGLAYREVQLCMISNLSSLHFQLQHFQLLITLLLSKLIILFLHHFLPPCYALPLQNVYILPVFSCSNKLNS